MTDRRYTPDPCECGDAWCSGCEEAATEDRDERVVREWKGGE